MADDFTLTAEEKAAILEAREKSKKPRKVTVHARDEAGTEYSFDLEGDEAETVVSRHAALFTKPADPDDKKPPRPTLLPRAKSG